MRPIKFRAWDKKTKIMFPVAMLSWLAGGLSVSDPASLEGFSGEGMELIQYTGLKDKNGKEIYEGHIFKDDEWWVGKAVVEFNNGMFGFRSDGKEEFISLFDCKNIEVIGNVWEHPELLKGLSE